MTGVVCVLRGSQLGAPDREQLCVGSSPLSSNLSWTHSLQKLVRNCNLLWVRFQESYVRVEVSGRIVAVGLFRGSGKCQLLRIVLCQLFPRCSTRAIASRMAKTAIASIDDRIGGVEQVGKAQFREGGGDRAPMSRAWYWSGCKSSTRMGIADAYLSDAITGGVFTGFSSPLASVTSTAARSAALSLLLRIQVSKVPQGTAEQGQVLPQEQLGKRRTSSRAARISSRLRSIMTVL